MTVPQARARSGDPSSPAAGAHARARSGGPLVLAAGEPAPPGMLRLTADDSTGVALPLWPDGVTPSLLEEYQVAPVPVERSGETRRVLAACLKCCWTDLSTDPWPGGAAPLDDVLDTYRALIGRTDDLMRSWAIGALRRLHDSAWVVLSEGFVRLGPRCATWPVDTHAHLKELLRRLPDPTPTQTPLTPTPAAAAPTPDKSPSPGTTNRPIAAAPDADADADADAASSLTAAGPGPGTTSGPIAAAPGTTSSPIATGLDAGSALPLAAAADAASADTADDAGAPSPVSATNAAGSADAAGTHAAGPPDAADAALPGAGTDATDAATSAPAPAIDDSPLRAATTDAASSPRSDGIVGGRVEGPEAEFDDLLESFDERRRAELVAAFMAVEYAAEPVQEARFGALRDPALRHALGEMLARRGRVLIQLRERWTSGYADKMASTPGLGAPGLGEAERAVLTLVLVHSVAIPRTEGLLPEDSWLSPHPTNAEELRRHTQLPIGELEAALRTLRHAGLLGQVKAAEEAGGYVPGPQFHRLTPAARRRLQEELILAAGPHTPLAAAVRARRTPARASDGPPSGRVGGGPSPDPAGDKRDGADGRNGSDGRREVSGRAEG